MDRTCNQYESTWTPSWAQTSRMQLVYSTFSQFSFSIAMGLHVKAFKILFHPAKFEMKLVINDFRIAKHYKVQWSSTWSCPNSQLHEKPCTPVSDCALNYDKIIAAMKNNALSEKAFIFIYCFELAGLGKGPGWTFKKDTQAVIWNISFCFMITCLK